MKTLETIEHVQIEFFILIIRVRHVSLIDIWIKAVQTLWENEILVYINICSTHLKLKKCQNMWLYRILKTECNLQHFTRNCKIKNLDNFERDETEAYLRRAGLLNVREKQMTICSTMKRCLVMFLRWGKVNVGEYWWNIVAKLKLNNWALSKCLSY